MLNETHNKRTLRWLATASLAITSAAGVVAWAADPTPAENGLMTFPNVRVVSVPLSPADPSAAQAPETRGGFKAYVDPATGRLVRPTHEARAALAAAARAQARLQAAQPLLTFTSPHGGVGMRRDETHASYLLARRNADGTLAMACVHGQHAAEWLSKGEDVTNRRAVKRESK